MGQICIVGTVKGTGEGKINPLRGRETKGKLSFHEGKVLCVWRWFP